MCMKPQLRSNLEDTRLGSGLYCCICCYDFEYWTVYIYSSSSAFAPPSLPCNITITSFWLKINGYGGDQIFREPGPVPGLQTKITTIRDPDNYKASNNNCLFCPLFKLVTILSSGCTSR